LIPVPEIKQFTPRDRKDESSPAAPARAPAIAPPAAPAPPAPSREPAGKSGRRGPTRMILLIVLPLIALVAGGYWWMTGGRYVTTDNAYIGAEKVMITPQISGQISHIDVVEGQHVKVGDKLFEIDPAPYNTALSLAEGRLAAARIEYENLQVSYKGDQDQIKMGQEAVRVRKSDYDRKSALLSQRAGTAVDLDTSSAALIQAQEILAFVQQMGTSSLIKLGGSLDAPLEKFPDYIQARAAVEDAQRNLRNTVVVAPIAGVATQVPQIQLGRTVAAGAPVFAVVADRGLWVDGNPKESDLTYVRTGLPATVTVDTFPDRSWRGKVGAIAPGTGSQFSILPAQNASGNWVKVVQRVPLRVEFDPDQDTTGLRAGMSAYISIDTGRQRTLRGVLSNLKDAIFGSSASAHAGADHSVAPNGDARP
jgi:membrane fusion protein (multidrug efflux system)